MKFIIPLLLAALSLPAAQTLVQVVPGVTNCTSTTGTTCASNTLSATGTGNLLVFVVVMNGSGHTIVSVATSGSWVIPANCSNSTATVSVCFAYCLSSVSGLTSVSATIDTTNVGRTSWLYEFSNSGLGWTLDQAPTGTTGASSATQTGIAYSLGGSNDALIQAVFAATQVVNSINLSYTINNNSNTSRAAAYLLNTTTVTAPTWTFAGASTANMAALAFKDSTSASSVKHRAIIAWTPDRILNWFGL